MVAARVAALCWLLAQSSPAKQMPTTTKAVVLMALLGIALLGLLLVVLVLLGGHWVRRIGSHRRGPTVPPDLVLRRSTPEPTLDAGDPHHTPGETIVDDSSRDTRNS